jgi:hypothetical protein
VQDPAASYDQFGELHGAVAPAVAHNHRANEATPLLARLKTALKSKMRGGSGEVRQGTPGCNAVQHVATNGLHLPKVRRSFSYLDKNKTGTVNREDLRVVFRDIGIALDKKHELALMQAAAPRSARLGSVRCVRACVRASVVVGLSVVGASVGVSVGTAVGCSDGACENARVLGWCAISPRSVSDVSNALVIFERCVLCCSSSTCIRLAKSTSITSFTGSTPKKAPPHTRTPHAHGCAHTRARGSSSLRPPLIHLTLCLAKPSPCLRRAMSHVLSVSRCTS